MLEKLKALALEAYGEKADIVEDYESKEFYHLKVEDETVFSGSEEEMKIFLEDTVDEMVIEKKMTEGKTDEEIINEVVGEDEEIEFDDVDIIGELRPLVIKAEAAGDDTIMFPTDKARILLNELIMLYE